MFVCGHSNVPTLTSPPVLKLLDSQGYLWLPYDLAEVIKLIEETFELKEYLFFQKNTLCHSFWIIVIPSEYCHSFQIIVILNSSQFPLIPKGQENWPAEPAIFANIF